MRSFVGVATRVSTKYWAEHIGRPYQPPETFALFGYQALLAKPRPYDLFWEIWGLGSHRILLWGSPDFARRIVSTLTLSNTLGFEVDAPPTQKGYGNRPGRWDVFNDAQSARKFWHWDFERYWFFYLLWGRLSYNPATPRSSMAAKRVGKECMERSSVMAAQLSQLISVEA